MTDPTPLSDDELAKVRQAYSGPAQTAAWIHIARLLATVDAERARADQAAAERDELAAQLQAVLSEGLTADGFRRKYLDASPTEGNPDE